MIIPSERPPARLIFPRLGGFYALVEPVGYLLLRVSLGLVLLTHGLPKLLRTAHGSMADPYGGTVALVQNKLGLPLPYFLADCVVVLETVGAVGLMLGLLTRVVAPMIAIEMALICLSLWPTWVWADRGMEYPFFLGGAALYVALRGGGAYSLDRLIGREV